MSLPQHLGRNVLLRNGHLRTQRTRAASASTSSPRYASHWTKLLTTVHGVDRNLPLPHLSAEDADLIHKQEKAARTKAFKSNEFERANMLYSLSFATPFSNFAGDQSRKISTATTAHYELSPLMAAQLKHAVENRRTVSTFSLNDSIIGQKAEKSHIIEGVSFASPFSDFCGSSYFDNTGVGLAYSSVERVAGEVTANLSFATPFSDSVGRESVAFSDAEYTNQKKRIAETMRHHIATSESSVTATGISSMAEKEHTWGLQESISSIDDLERDDLDSALPRTLEEALQYSKQARVITRATAPFEIVSANAAWEELCGYKKEEYVGKTLNILQGPDTDEIAATAVVSQLLKGHDAGTVLVNYNKNGRKFHNRLRVCPLTEASQKNNREVITHFLGVLLEVDAPKQAQLAV